jgi:hypothetical protein
MGISSSKTKATNEPWSQAQPYILGGVDKFEPVSGGGDVGHG